MASELAQGTGLAAVYQRWLHFALSRTSALALITIYNPANKESF